MADEEITTILQRIDDDREGALGQVFQRLYPELKRIATAKLRGGRQDGTLSPTVLVGELYMRFSATGSMRLQDRRHFYVCAAKAMRHILIDHARESAANKRGGDRVQVTLNDAQMRADDVDWIDLNRALEELGQIAPELHELVDLKYFGGLNTNEIAELTGESARSVTRKWTRARALLHAKLSPPD